MKVLPKTIDRSIARMIATKRLITGSLGIAAGIATLVVVLDHGGRPPPTLALALLFFLGGGAWSLRDGLRLRRELQK